MSKTSKSIKTSRPVIGRYAAQKINAVEGIRPNERTQRLLAESEQRGESGEALRKRIRDEFSVSR